MTEPTLEAGHKVGQYRLLKPLGTGTFGTTWLAKDEDLNRHVALKFLKGSGLPLDEARRLAEVCSRHTPLDYVVRVHQLVRGEHPCIVMEYVEGQTLQAYLKQAEPLEPHIWWRTLQPLLLGLQKVHEAGLVHRDIKPANVILRHNQIANPTIVDFGAARAADSDLSQVIATPRYAAPEVNYQQRPERSWDIYSLAVISYEAILGVEYDREHPDYTKMLRMLSASDNALLQAVGRGLLAGYDRPKSVTEWLASMVDVGEVPTQDDLDFDGSRDSGTMTSHFGADWSPDTSLMAPTPERSDTIAKLRREIEIESGLPENSINLKDDEGQSIPGQMTIRRFLRKWGYKPDFRPNGEMENLVSVRQVRDGIEHAYRLPEKSVELRDPQGQKYAGQTLLKTVLGHYQHRSTAR